MKVLFIVKSTGLYERLGMMQIASVLKEHHHQVSLLKTESLTYEKIEGLVARFAPNVLAFSAMTGEHNYYINLNKKLKSKFDLFSVFGGSHPTFFPEMIEKEEVDAVCIGEGEHAMLELVTKLEKGEEICNIKNLWIKVNGEIKKNPVRPLIENLDELSFPDREFMYDGDKDLKLNKNKMFFTGRGCPYRCTYCFNHMYNQLYKGKGKVIRRRSVDNLIEEIVTVKERYPLESIHFGDDIFLLAGLEWMKEFSKKYRKEVGLPFICQLRADQVEEEIISLLKEAGCYSGFIGVECGDEELSKTLLRRNLSNTQIIEACKILKKYGIKFCMENLTVLPVENPLEVDMKTLNLNIQCNPDFAWSSILFPYPKTEMGEYCITHGYFHGNFDDIPETNKTVSTLHFSNQAQKKQAERLHKLFGLAVEFKTMRPFIKLLIRLPLDRLYLLLFFLWYGYCLRFRLEKTKKKGSDLILLGRNFYSYVSNLLKESKEKNYNNHEAHEEFKENKKNI